ncbi:TPA: hypothetical protein HA241_04935 [Candidatus Woesearchaeota archaeon]|nr:hypothetical protein [Candidatus Woesearchaeota archaeon]
MRLTHRVGGYALLAVIMGIIVVTILSQKTAFSFSSFREFFLQAGPWGYVLFSLLLIASIPLPIPSTPLMIVGGYVYGVVVGSIITFVGTVRKVSDKQIKQ